MYQLIISDLHLGKGKFLKNGQLNILEDFEEDDRIYEFFKYYSSGEYYTEKIHLILNGDILNLIQIDIEGIFTHIVDEEITFKALQKIYDGHPLFFQGIREFLSAPNKRVTYIIGNHDAAMGFEGAQKLFKKLVGDVNFCYELKEFGVHVEHGHRFEAINTVPKEKYFLEGPWGKKILNLPWGSLFCIYILPRLKKDRPYIDKIRPIISYVKWCSIHDFSFFLKMFHTVVSYLIQTKFDIYTKQNRNFRTTFKVLKQITIYPRYEKKAKSILKKNHNIHTVVMGHTHLREWRRFPHDKYYFNTGTWNTIPSIDAGMHQNEAVFTYCLLKVSEKENCLVEGKLNNWKGRWKPFSEDVIVS